MKLKFFLITIVILCSSMLFGADKTVVLKVSGIGWPGRAYKVSSTLKKVAGVKQADADYRSKKVKIVYDNAKVKSATLIKKIESIGFKVVK